MPGRLPPRRLPLLCLVLLGCTAGISSSDARAESYDEAKARAAAVRDALRADLRRVDARSEKEVEQAVIGNVRDLAGHWLGTAWGLGPPQADAPGPDRKINCGTFVGTVLRDAGFVVDVAKLQRQPSQLIIRSFVGRDRTRRFSNASMARFLAGVKEMGPGLFIIGLDVHVGLLVQTEDELRFVHASYVTGTVVDEDAAAASPIVDSKYRVVGKILSRENLDAWLDGRRIEVVGDW
jgi:hypothetical protein